MATLEERLDSLEIAVKNDIRTLRADMAAIKTNVEGFAANAMHLGQKYWWAVGLIGVAAGFVLGRL